MKKILLLTLITFNISSSYSQTDSLNIEKRNWSIGISLQPLFHPPESNFLFNLKHSIGNHKIRLSIGTDASVSSSTGSSYNFDYAVALGYQKDHYIKKWGVYSGLDIFYEKSFTKSTSGFDSDTYSKINTFSAGLKPFAGFEFRVNNRLSFSSEVGLNFFIGKYESENRSGLSSPIIKSESDNAGIRLNPSQILNVNYYF